MSPTARIDALAHAELFLQVCSNRDFAWKCMLVWTGATVERAGLKTHWDSGPSIARSLDYRDANEAAYR
ncbi:hypothetical protein KIP88_40330 [Bradyrhizobium sp. SRL28]|uniref:hypothetical protein n=1 Tax=Bradyrhizobium sp. SRL28 TaxID=2836178 RepID=UPI001BDE4FB1|nr:hypothetical protein [Bradyrhizobium sp. SRL28]MBT1516671.1 hypothetical protein [Bradyrhizobium sp. SRL28]